MSGRADGRMRFVAIGDSLTEGVGDEPWPDGTPRGYADRLAAILDECSGGVDYANLAVRGYRAAQVRDTQVATAVAMEPDVVTLTAGMNDLLRPRLDVPALHSTLIDIVEPLTSRGARLVIVPIPDVSSVSPVGSLLQGRRRTLNAIYADLVRHHGVQPLTDTTGTVFEDRRAWAEDRLHLSALGHERLAWAAAVSLGFGEDPDVLLPPEGTPPPRTVVTETAWVYEHVAPWVGRRARGRSSGDGAAAKRPQLQPVTAG